MTEMQSDLVGILGGGQLGRMLALAGLPMAVRFRFLDPAPDACAGQVAEHITGEYEDETTLARFASGASVITYEFENVPSDAAAFLAERVPVYPPPSALQIAGDRLHEKNFFQSLGIPTPPYKAVDSWSDLQNGLNTLGTPAVLKTRRFGYDGKGQVVLHSLDDAQAAWDQLGSRPLILEGFAQFTRELSIISVRSKNGEIAFYPLAENHHSEGILRLSLAPAPGLSPSLQASAESYAKLALEAMDYVGVLAIELFEVGGELWANEMAPRVHNSGHWTIEGAETSQFENHLRAILGRPLGSTEPRGYSAMLNLIGEVPEVRKVLQTPGAHLHLYGKEPRPGRKIGHITLRADDPTTLAAMLQVMTK